MSDPDYAAAGTAIEGLGDDGKEFISTYGIPTGVILLGIGFVWALTNKVGKRLRGAV